MEITPQLDLLIPLFLFLKNKAAPEIHLGSQQLPRVLPRQKYCRVSSNIYIQFTIFNTYLSTKLSFTNKRYHLHVLEKCLYVLQLVRSIIYFRQLIHPLSLRLRGNRTGFAFTWYIIVSVKFCDVTFLNNFSSFF